jgi:hypothetical protein
MLTAKTYKAFSASLFKMRCALKRIWLIPLQHGLIIALGEAIPAHMS